MDIEGFKFTCVGSARFVGPNEIPFFEFEFRAAETDPKTLSDDDKSFLKVTQGIIKINTLDAAYFTVGTDYYFGFSDSAPVAAGKKGS